jgi:myo-inositol-1(or 4)-monophosphatase
MNEGVLPVLLDAADAVADAIRTQPDWGRPGRRPGQYVVDEVADAAAVEVLASAGLGVLSEESGRRSGDGDVVVALDPLDGSDNAVRGIGPYGVSLCAVDRSGPAAAVVVDLLLGARFTAVRGGGAYRDGARIHASACRRLDDAVLALSGHPPEPLAGRTRSWGAAALELCAVADGRFDAFLHWGFDHHGPWDYLGGVLVCLEAGACTADALGRDLVCVGHTDRRRPMAAGTPELLAELRAAATAQAPGASTAS